MHRSGVSPHDPAPMTDPDPHHSERRRLRHDLAGAFNELRLCAEVIRIEADLQRVLEWLDQIEQAAARCESLVAQLQLLPPP